MLLHQHIRFTLHDRGNAAYLRIPITTTFWTTIERRNSHEEIKSPEFPSRIIEPETPNSVTLTGIDSSRLFLQPSNESEEYKISWRLTRHEESDITVMLPLDRPISFGCSHGTTKHLGVIVGGVDIQISFDLTTKTLSTNWFLPPTTSLWSFPILQNLIESKNQFLISDDKSQSSIFQYLSRIWCCNW